MMPLMRIFRGSALTSIVFLLCATAHGQVRRTPSFGKVRDLRPASQSHDFVNNQGWPSTPNLTYFGGALMTHASYWMVYWGPYWTSGIGLSQRKHFTSFVQTAAPSTAFAGQFAEYQEPGNPILTGSFAGEVLIPTAPAASTTDAGIQSQISAWITTATLPVPDANTVFVVLFPAGADVNSGGSACGNFFGYHNESTSPTGAFGRYRYIVLPYQNCGGDIAVDSPVAIHGMTDTLGHEMSETETDPDVGNLAYGWYDAVLGQEIADICVDDAATFGFQNFWMQKLWSDAAATCIAPSMGSASIHLTISASVGSVPTGAANLLPHFPTNYTISTDSASPVSLNISDMPPGVTYTLNRSSVTASEPATLEVSTNSNPGAAGFVTVTGTQNSQQAQFQLLITPWRQLSAVNVTNSSFLYNSTLRAYAGTITLENTGSEAIGPTLLVGFHELSYGAKPLSVLGSASQYVETAPNGDYAVQFPDGMLAPGSFVTANVAFLKPGNGSLTFTPQIFEIQGATACDLSQNGFTSATDVQLIINEALGITKASNDLNGDGTVNVVDVEIVTNSALSLGCTSYDTTNH